MSLVRQGHFKFIAWNTLTVRANSGPIYLCTNTQSRPLNGSIFGIFGGVGVLCRGRGRERGIRSDLRNLLALASFKEKNISYSSVHSAKSLRVLKMSRVGRSLGEYACAAVTSMNCTMFMYIRRAFCRNSQMSKRSRQSDARRKYLLPILRIER